MTFTPTDPNTAYPVVIYRHTWIPFYTSLSGIIFGSIAYLHDPYLPMVVACYLGMAHPGIAYSIFRFRKATIYRDKIIYSGFFRKLHVDLSGVDKVYLCDQYVWGGDWHLIAALGAASRTRSLRNMNAKKMRRWNYKPGLFYVDNQGVSQAMLLSRSYKDWRYALKVLPDGAEVEHIKDKIHPDLVFWYNITPSREQFIERTGCFIYLFMFSVLCIFIATPIVAHYVEAWLR